MKNDRINKYRFSSVSPLVLIGEEVVEERGTQAEILNKELIQYKVLLKDLATTQVPYTVKDDLLNIAFYIVENIEWLESFEKTKKIPNAIIGKKFTKTKSFLEQWKDYIITYILILSNPKYKHLQDYLRVIDSDESNTNYESSKDLFKKELKGIVVKANGKNPIIMTSTGSFHKAKLSERASIGEEVEGERKKRIRDYKLQISLLISMSIILVGISIFMYFNVTSTIMVKTTSPIMLEINALNRVKSINSATERGKELVDSIDVLDKSLDTALLSIIQYANSNEMLPFEGIIVMVNGKQVKYGILPKTENYIYAEQIEIRFNNSGVEQKFN